MHLVQLIVLGQERVPESQAEDSRGQRKSTPEEPAADQGGVAVAVAEAVRGAVDGDQALAALNVVEQGGLGLRRQVAAVAEEGQGVVLRQVLRGQRPGR